MLRTTAMAAAVTIGCAALAYPVAYHLAKVASSRTKALIYLGIVLPLWASYIVRVYAWRNILSQEGVLYWFADKLHLTGVVDAVVDAPFIGGATLSDSWTGQWLVFIYVWIPYMILPIQPPSSGYPSPSSMPRPTSAPGRGTPSVGSSGRWRCQGSSPVPSSPSR